MKATLAGLDTWLGAETDPSGLQTLASSGLRSGAAHGKGTRLELSALVR